MGHWIATRSAINSQTYQAAPMYTAAPIMAGALTVTWERPNTDVNRRVRTEFRIWLASDGYH